MFKKIKAKAKATSENIKEYNKYKANKKGLLVDTDGNSVTLEDSAFDMEKVKAGKKEKRAIIVTTAVGVGVGVAAGTTYAILKAKKSREEPELVEGTDETINLEG